MNHEVKVVLEDLNYLRHTAKNLSYKVMELCTDQTFVDEVFTEIVDDFDAVMDVLAEEYHEED